MLHFLLYFPPGLHYTFHQSKSYAASRGECMANRLLLALVLIVIIGATGYIFSRKDPSFHQNPSASEQDAFDRAFVDLLIKYYADKDLERLLSLYYFEGAPEDVRSSVTEELKRHLQLGIASIELTPIKDNSFDHLVSGFIDNDGRLMIGNGTPVKQLSIQFQTRILPDGTVPAPPVLPVGMIDGRYVILTAGYAPESTIRKISVDQMNDIIKTMETSKSKWPLAVGAADKLFSRFARLPEGYQELLGPYKVDDDDQSITYELYDYREPGFYQGRYNVTIRVHRQTGLLLQPPERMSPMPIYGNYSMVFKKDAQPEDKPYIVADEMKPVGEMAPVSKLKSTAEVSECGLVWTNQVLETLTGGFPPRSEFHDGRWSIAKVHDLIPINCSTADYGNYSIVVIYFLLVADSSDKRIIGNKLLWIAQYDRSNGRLGDVIYTGLTNDSAGEMVTDLRVEALADVNSDGYHDIILKDSHFTKTDYIVLMHDPNGSFVKRNVRTAGSIEAD